MFNGDKMYGNWVGHMQDFMVWLSAEQRKCVPKGICGQDCMTTSGLRGLLGKYPTFEHAYSVYAVHKIQSETKE